MVKSNTYFFRATTLYKKALQQALEIFELNKGYPYEKLYSLIDKTRRSSRSVSSNYAEAHRKRMFRKYYSQDKYDYHI